MSSVSADRSSGNRNVCSFSGIYAASFTCGVSGYSSAFHYKPAIISYIHASSVSWIICAALFITRDGSAVHRERPAVDKDASASRTGHTAFDTASVHSKGSGAQINISAVIIGCSVFYLSAVQSKGAAVYHNDPAIIPAQPRGVSLNTSLIVVIEYLHIRACIYVHCADSVISMDRLAVQAQIHTACHILCRVQVHIIDKIIAAAVRKSVSIYPWLESDIVMLMCLFTYPCGIQSKVVLSGHFLCHLIFSKIPESISGLTHAPSGKVIIIIRRRIRKIHVVSDPCYCCCLIILIVSVQ